MAHLRALRPKQWVKNGLLFLPILFAINQVWSLNNLEPIPGLLLRLVTLFLAFCLVSSSVYLFNDLLDREADRRHPTKRHRPIASGSVTVPIAIVLMLILGLGGLSVMFYLDWVLGGIGILYIGINVAYSWGAKKAVLVDIIMVVSGYVIRAGAGAVAVGVVPSSWLYMVTAAGAMFIVLGRRYAEVRLSGKDAEQQRSVLRSYTGPFISQLLSISATAALVSYTLYAVEAKNLPANQTMLLTVPFVVFGLFRYLYLLNTSPEAEYPERLVTRDAPFLTAVLGWIVAVILVLVLNS
ncbi:MAG: decaprenyl-phosphate phosphoribosyltransferase [SAR202 cluster bacterium Casp-Chloro-G3]|nr:MAG: decaprenyl-phosphate phosphoribosyltransferase [SAR202 cluster bacterium Casp-Chloro-G3]